MTTQCIFAMGALIFALQLGIAIGRKLPANGRYFNGSGKSPAPKPSAKSKPGQSPGST